MAEVRGGKSPCPGFSDRLGCTRKKNGLSQEAFAEEMGFSLGAVKKWEAFSAGKGKAWSEPDLHTLCRIAKRLHVTTDYLLGLEDEENKPYRDVANTIGISQMAARKLREIAEKAEDGRNLPLNGLILAERFEEVLGRLLLLHNATDLLQTNPLGFNSDLPAALMQTTISGFEYVAYTKSCLMSALESLIDRITMYNETRAIYETAVIEQARQQLNEYGDDRKEVE